MDPVSDQNSPAANDRRNFLKRALAALPAAGVCCFLPNPASGSDAGSKSTGQNGWVCIQALIYEEHFKNYSLGYYVVENCQTGAMDLIALELGMPMGDCAYPASSLGCLQEQQLVSWERSKDFLRIAYSPDLQTPSQAEQQRIHAQIGRRLAA